MMSGDRATVTLSVTALVVCAAVVGAMYVPGVVVLGAVAVVVAAALARFVVRARRHQQLDGALRRSSVPAVVADTPVRLAAVEDSAFVSGLLRPTIYCSRNLPCRLTVDELRAVLLHERAHQQSRDPFWLLLLEVVTPVARLHRRGRAWLERAVAAREIAADHRALEHGATRRALASALIKVAPVPDGRFPGFASSAELRLRALLAPDASGPTSPRRWPWVVAGAVVAIAACMSTWSVVEVLCCR